MRFLNNRTQVSTSRLLRPLTGSIAAGLFLSLSACSTVPDDAPKEYHLAEAAIDRADDANADKRFPITIERAKVDFKEALNLYDQSLDRDTPEPTRQGIAQAGSERAMMAQNLAEKAIDLHAQVGAWDQKIEMKDEAEKSAAELSALQSRVASLDEQVRNRDNQNAQFQANIKTPVAFFATSRAGVTAKFQDSLDSLANTLKNNPQLKVTLVGYADRTGAANINNRLSEQRAESVAQELRAKGVMADQILIDSHGSTMATASAGNQAGLQLDRRVDAILTNRSGLETMTTGR
jgi:outer membrane protein OmpA-like peptidoglycan-associated protein